MENNLLEKGINENEAVAEVSAAEEPVAEEPAVEEAAVEETVVEETVVEETVVEETVVEKTVVEETVVEESVPEIVVAPVEAPTPVVESAPQVEVQKKQKRERVKRKELLDKPEGGFFKSKLWNRIALGLLLLLFAIPIAILVYIIVTFFL